MNFIIVSNPGQRASAKTTRRVHSHAARIAHAKTRRRDVAEYNSIKTGRKKDDIRGVSTPKYTKEQSEQSSIAVPRILSGDFQSDGICRFRQHLSSMEHFVFNHYIQTVLPAQISYCPVVMGLKEKVMDIRSHWMSFVASDPIILRGFLLAACRHLSLVELQDNFADMAIRYKLCYLRGVQESMFINESSSRREAVSMTIVLSFDEVMCGNHSMAAKHVLGAISMIDAAGGIEALELNDVVRYILCSLLYGKRLVDRNRELFVMTESLTPDSIWP
ncbi:hypothetical protein FPOA_05255 [Fusarium poae]|uniref:Uncharacterized protein n=1 Tax=Fusarium poae TaxID=36050 RepID=A0A1B8AW11_FUSPO|nr:hypothetical protein FPOA_05255 [Fusarium poae]